MQRRTKIGVAAVLVVALAGGALWYALGRKPAPTTGSPATWGGGAAELTLTPVKGDADGVDVGAGFVLASSKPLKLVAVQEQVAIQPPVPVTVEQRGGSGKEFLVKPTRALEADRIYRVRVPAAAGVSRTYQWSFQTKAVFRLLGSLPRHQGAGVPVNTGIELTFSHDDYADPGALFSIEPKVEGRFERHKRTLAFVPASPLQPGTVYTVTLKKGLTRTGGEGRLADDFTFSFETEPDNGGKGQPEFFAAPTGVQEFPVGEAPYFLVWVNKIQQPMNVTIYKYSDATAFVDAVGKADEVPGWAYWSRSRYREDPARLARQTAFTGELKDSASGPVLLFPDSLPAGYYLADLKQGSATAQVRFQVTDLSSYAIITSTRTMVWLNDLKSGKPLAGAKVTFAGGGDSATSDASGIAMIATPPGASDPDRPSGIYLVAQAAGKEAVIAAQPEPVYRWYGAEDRSQANLYWKYLYVDRPLYRPSDKVNLFGIVRAREQGAQPVTEVTAQISRNEYMGPDQKPLPLVQSTLKVEDATFAGTLELPGLNPGWYELKVLVDGAWLQSQYFEVANYTKPAYALELTPSRHAVLTGDEVTFRIKASFFEGTPVARLPLDFSFQGQTRQVQTDVDGTATVTMNAYRADGGLQYFDWANVRATMPEAGEMTAQSMVQIFGAEVSLESNVKVETGQAVVTGTVNRVDLTGLNEGTSQEFRGLPAVGRPVSITLVEESWEATPAGEIYDFIAKTVQKRYDYRQTSREVGRFSAVTAEGGAFSVSLPVRPDKSYRAEISTRDADGRSTSQHQYFSGKEYRGMPGYYEASRWFSLTPDRADRVRFGLGEAVSLSMRDGNALPPERAQSYLFYTSRLGLQEHRVQDLPTFQTALKASDAPNTWVRGVYFDGRNYYVSGEFLLRLDPKERELKVSVTTDKPAYRPGELVKVQVAAADKSGKPVRARVNLNAVDEALFALRNQWADPLEQLYGEVVPSGVLLTAVSHEVPRPGVMAEKGGDGGEPRQNFKDAAYFATLTTDSSGKAAGEFRVPDNLTSWRLTWQALEPGTMQAASGTVKVPVSLPFFVETVQGATYLVGDQPAVLARTYGTALKDGDQVKLTGRLAGPVSREMSAATARAFATLTFALPRLEKPGAHSVTVEAEGPAGLKDALEKELTVTESFLRQKVVSFSLLEAGKKLSGPSEGVADVVFSDYERGEYLQLLQELQWQWGNRFEQKLSRSAAAGMMKTYFPDLAGWWGEEPELDTFAYQAPDGSIAILPYAGGDLRLSVLAADLMPDGFDRIGLEAYFRSVLDDEGAARDRKLLALYGMAALDRPVLQEAYRLLKTEGLSYDERLWLALAVAELGDLEGARPLYLALMAEQGEQLGAQYRVKLGSDQDEILTRTALAGVLAAKVGEPEAPGLAAYLQENQAKEVLLVLEKALIANAALPQLADKPVSFTYKLDGKTEKQELKPGEFRRMDLTAKALAGLEVQQVQGKVGATVIYEGPLNRADLKQQQGFTVKRSYSLKGGSAANTFHMGDVVRVTLEYAIPETAPGGTYELSDYLPAGLRLIERPWQQGIKFDKPGDPAWPMEADGQRVTFWAGRSGGTLSYYARVITPGTYTAEEPVLQHQHSGMIYGHGERAQVVLQ